MNGDERSVYVISVAAQLAGVHPQTLRIYERKGLLEPRRTAGNTRRYSDDDIARLHRIQELTQDAGVNLAGVKMVMSLEEHIRDLEDRLIDAERRMDDLRRHAAEAVDEVHRSYRRDLVPLAPSVPAVMTWSRSRRGGR